MKTHAPRAALYALFVYAAFVGALSAFVWMRVHTLSSLGIDTLPSALMRSRAG